MAGQVCVDASLALMLLLPHDLTPQADALWQSWAADDTNTVSPPLFFAEVTSVLRECVYIGRLGAEEGKSAFSAFMNLGIRGIHPAHLQARAWRLAKEHNRPRAYDAQYLALADLLGCELWTGDRRLVNALHLPWVKWVGDFSPRRNDAP
ncbi:MAG: type II toxin-antitoxin system VapC family toxin [Chloroflexi bacterium]|nr:type II toxin-antitoxin system VapC family toxin [Chloroflexota bacterium]